MIKDPEEPEETIFSEAQAAEEANDEGNLPSDRPLGGAAFSEAPLPGDEAPTATEASEPPIARAAEAPRRSGR